MPDSPVVPDVPDLDARSGPSPLPLSEAECLRRELEEKTLEADALHRVCQAMANAPDLDEMLRVVASVAVSVTGTEACFLYLLDEARNELVMRAVHGADSSVVGKIRLHFDEGVTGWVARERKRLAIAERAWMDSRFKSFPELREEQFHSFLSMPIVAKERTIGVINVRTRTPHRYTQGQMNVLDTIAGLVASHIELARLYHTSATKASQINALSEVSKSITSNLYLEEILQLIVAMTADTMGFVICSILLLSDEGDELVIGATSTESGDYLNKPNLKVSQSVAGSAVVQGQPVIVEDVRQAPGYQYPDLAVKEGLCGLIAVPLVFKQRIIGVLNCYTGKPHHFTDDEIGLLTALANQAALAIENSKLMVRSAIIQEMHHRIKNNLQTIASLLRLQIHHKRGSVEEILRESISRILSIAAVHDLLSRGDLDVVSFRKMAESILSAMKQHVMGPARSISTRLEGGDLMLDSSQATSMALVLNELVANAVEHGLSDDRPGEVVVSLDRQGNEVVMEVRNTGQLLPEGFCLAEADSLGLRIVESLTRETLQGRFTLLREPPFTVARVTFPAALAR